MDLGRNKLKVIVSFSNQLQTSKSHRYHFFSCFQLFNLHQSFNIIQAKSSFYRVFLPKFTWYISARYPFDFCVCFWWLLCCNRCFIPAAHTPDNSIRLSLFSLVIFLALFFIFHYLLYLTVSVSHTVVHIFGIQGHKKCHLKSPSLLTCLIDCYIQQFSTYPRPRKTFTTLETTARPFRLRDAEHTRIRILSYLLPILLLFSLHFYHKFRPTCDSHTWTVSYFWHDLLLSTSNR